MPDLHEILDAYDATGNQAALHDDLNTLRDEAYQTLTAHATRRIYSEFIHGDQPCDCPGETCVGVICFG